MSVEFDPRTARYREVNKQHINKILRKIQALSQAEETGVSMWETQLQFTYSDYALDCERKEVLLDQVKLLYNNLKPEAPYGNVCNTGAEQIRKMVLSTLVQADSVQVSRCFQSWEAC